MSHPDPSTPPDLRPIELGEVLENPVTRERAVIIELPWQNAQGRAVTEMTALRGARVVGEHLHPAIHESFTVLQGELTVIRDGQRFTLGAGESADIEPGVWHDWFNRGAVDAVVRVEVTPGERFAHMIETLFGLARDGHVNAKGMPDLLQVALTAQEFSDVIVFRKPPPRVQRIVFGLGTDRTTAWVPRDLREPLAHNTGAEGAEPCGRLTIEGQPQAPEGSLSKPATAPSARLCFPCAGVRSHGNQPPRPARGGCDTSGGLFKSPRP